MWGSPQFPLQKTLGLIKSLQYLILSRLGILCALKHFGKNWHLWPTNVIHNSSEIGQLTHFVDLEARLPFMSSFFTLNRFGDFSRLSERLLELLSILDSSTLETSLQRSSVFLVLLFPHCLQLRCRSRTSFWYSLLSFQNPIWGFPHFVSNVPEHSFLLSWSMYLWQ